MSEATVIKPRPLARALGMSIADVDSIVRFAEREERRGQLDDAIETLRVAAVLDPRFLSTWDVLSRCLDKRGATDKAAAAARVAKKLRAHGAGVER